jgi:ethanolamine utilization cobalamin adenosyltransferase
MFVCRTLDYIVNEDLHKYLDEKLTYIKNKGVEVEIELTEPIDDIIIDTKELINMIEQIIDDALVLMKETDNKKLLFCSFYHEDALWVIIRYNATVTTPLRYLNKKLNKILNKYININSNMTYEESSLTQELIIYKERG